MSPTSANTTDPDAAPRDYMQEAAGAGTVSTTAAVSKLADLREKGVMTAEGVDQQDRQLLAGPASLVRPENWMAPVARRSSVTRRSRSARVGVLGSLREGASDVVQSVVNEVAPGVVDALDVDEVIQRVDIQAVLDRIDLNELLDKVDLDLLLSRMDVDALLERVDVNALVERTELASIIARSGAGVAGMVLDEARSVGVGLDSFVHRWVDRVLRRDPASRPVGPPLLVSQIPTSPTS